MRANEFLIEDDADANEIEQLQQEIANRVTKVADVALLNKVSSLLRTSTIGNIANMAFRKDEDAAKFVTRLSELIVGLDVPINDKAKFLREFGRMKDPNYFIDAKTLFNRDGTIQSMENWWKGSGMATTMFKLMINDPYLTGKHAGGCGPGEIAIAAFHPKISVGVDAAHGYDLKYGNDEIEVKTKASDGTGGGGRWTATAEEPLVAYASQPDSLFDPTKLPNKVVISNKARSAVGLHSLLNDPQYLKNPDNPLTEQQQKDIYARLLKIAYSRAQESTISDTVAQYPMMSSKSIAPCAFESYKAKQEFSSMLIMKVAGGTVQTIHFTDINAVINQFSLNTLYVKGEQRGMSLQATIR